MPASREDISEQDEVRFVLCAVGELEAVEVCVGDPEKLGLTTLVGSHCHVAVRTACEAAIVRISKLLSSFGRKEKGEGKLRIHACAEGSSSFLAVTAATIGDVEWHHDSVSFLQKRHARPRLEDDAHVFMACSPRIISTLTLLNEVSLDGR